MISLVRDPERLSDFSECYRIVRDDGLETGHWLVAYVSTEKGSLIVDGEKSDGNYIYRFAYINQSGGFSWVMEGKREGGLPDPWTFGDRNVAMNSYVRNIYHETGFMDELRQV